MTKAIKVYVGTRAADYQVTLTQFEYSDGTTNHWLFRDRLGRPYNPVNQAEVDKIINDWKLVEA